MTESSQETPAHGILVAFDLDDTLLPEWRFVASGASLIARILQKESGIDTSRLPAEMIRALLRGGNHFDALELWLKRNSLPIEECMPRLVGLHRNHFPSALSLPPAALECLQTLKNAGIPLALITDGRSSTQRNKINALKLTRFFEDSNIFISEETGCDKKTPFAFQKLMNRYPGREYIYVGDNPSKDFLMPSRLDWTGICLLDAGNYNIHPQPQPLPDGVIPLRSLRSLPDLLIEKFLLTRQHD